MRISDWSSDVCSSDLGFSGANSWFSAWFSGLQPVPDATAHVAAPPSLVADTLLAELSLSAWAPLADTAIQIRAAAHFHRGAGAPQGERSEEHTSELQSLIRHSSAVLCLTKKKKHKQQ